MMYPPPGYGPYPFPMPPQAAGAHPQMMPMIYPGPMYYPGAPPGHPQYGQMPPPNQPPPAMSPGLTEQ